MDKKNDLSFKDMNLKEKAATVVGVTILIILVTGFVLGIFFLGFLAFFKAIGVQYESIWSLVIFVVSLFIVGLIFEPFFNVLTKLSLQKTTGKVKAFIIQMFFGFTSSWIGLLIVDGIMGSINLSFKTKLVAVSHSQFSGHCFVIVA